MTAEELFESALSYLEKNYSKETFFTERDLVWTIQKYLIKTISEKKLPFCVISEYRLMPNEIADLAIMENKLSNIKKYQPVNIAIEFKYEPNQIRKDIDIPSGKFPVTDWKEITIDIDRIENFVYDGKAKIGYAILIDEGGRYKSKPIENKTKLIEWQNGVFSFITKIRGH